MDARKYRGSIFNFGFCAFFACSAIGKFQNGTETGWTYLTLALVTVSVALSAYALLKKPHAQALKPGEARREK
jgi:hypothetical protein